MILFLIIEYSFTSYISFYNQHLFQFFILAVIIVLIYGITLSIKGIIAKRDYSINILIAVVVLTIFYFSSMLVFLDLVKMPVLLLHGTHGTRVKGQWIEGIPMAAAALTMLRRSDPFAHLAA